MLLLGNKAYQWQRVEMTDLDIPATKEELELWLAIKPASWAQVIAVRSALRVLPWIRDASLKWLRGNALHLLRSAVISWSASNDLAHNYSHSADRAHIQSLKAGQEAKLVREPTTVIEAAFAAANTSLSVANIAIIECAVASADAATKAGAGTIFWQSVVADCVWLNDHENIQDASRVLSQFSLFRPEISVVRTWDLSRLLELDLDFSVWVDWCARRARGQRAAFHIPGDRRRVEDKKILRRLADATDEDFWAKGHEYVNATLKGWLEEARARVAPPQPDGETEIRVPLQEPHAIAYGVNNDGMIDRLPHSDQAHLRDVPDQRRAYDDLREAAAELLDEGQRLGRRLQRALNRFLHSLPDGFEDAEAYLVWRDANALRRLHRAHREAAKSPEPDEARLEPVVAEGLGGLLDLYNNFAFADDGLRGKDEARVAPQERANAEAEATAAIPLVEALLANPQIATPEALDDILADAENAELPADDPYAAQVLLQFNESRKNFLAAALAWGAKTLASPKQVGKAVAIGSVTGAAGVVGKVAMTAIIGTDYGPLLPFIAVNAEILQRYVAIAFPSFEHLPSLIDQLKLLWAKRRH